MHGERLLQQLWHLQVRPLHLRQLGRAVLPERHLPDRVRLFQLRAGLFGVYLQRHDVHVPAMRQEGWPVLLYQQQQQQRFVHGRRNAVLVQQLDRPLRMQDLRLAGRGLL